VVLVEKILPLVLVQVEALVVVVVMAVLLVAREHQDKALLVELDMVHLLIEVVVEVVLGQWDKIVQPSKQTTLAVEGVGQYLQ